MSNPDEVSYISRFFVKFIEIIAAGLATAASGYLIAHLSTTWSSSTPTSATAVVASPSVGTTPAVSTQPTPPNVADTSQQPIAPQPFNAPNRPQSTQAASVPPTATVTKPEAGSRRIENSQKAAVSARDRGSSVRDSSDRESSDRGSWALRVRAALANAAHRSDLPDTSPRRRMSPPPVAAPVEPGVVTDPANSNAVNAATPSANEPRPVPPQVTIIANPQNAIEVNPAAPIQSSPAPLPGNQTGALSTLEQLLRNDPLAGADQPPRPPMPVGQE